MSEIRMGTAQPGQSAQSESLSEQGSRAVENGTMQLRNQIDQRTTRAGHEVRSLAGALRRSGSELEGEAGGGSMTRITSGVADRLDRVGGYLEQAKGDDLLRDAERFARKQPWLVAGAAALAGFTASRLLKASSERRYDMQQSNGGRSPVGSSWDSAPTAEISRSEWAEPSPVAGSSH